MLRFKLRTFLIAVGLFAIWMGWYSSSTQQQKRAVSAIQQLQGDVAFSHQYPSGKWQDDSERDFSGAMPGPKWVRAVIGDHYFLTPVALSFYPAQPGGVPLAADDLIHVGKLTSLEYLGLEGADVTGGIQYLKSLVALRVLDLSGTSVTEAELTEIAKLRKLERLDLSETAVTGNDLKDLAALSNLTELQLSVAPINGKAPPGLQELRKKLPKCSILIDTHWRAAQASKQ